MNVAVRIVGVMAALVLLTLLVYLPWNQIGASGVEGQFLGYGPIWSPPRPLYSNVAVGHLAVEVLAVIGATTFLTIALWNWPTRRGADPDGQPS